MPQRGHPCPSRIRPGSPRCTCSQRLARGAGRVFHGFNPTVEEKLVVDPMRRGHASVEQYRRLAATLHHAQADRGIRVVMVTSALPGEGKTLTATNLALTLSESYRRSVLLIDADLRRPLLHDTFQLPNVSGLSDGLKSGSERPLTRHRDFARAFRCCPEDSPSPIPMAGLTSERCADSSSKRRERYDWVILDTPPVGLLPDANLLVEHGGRGHPRDQRRHDSFALVQKASPRSAGIASSASSSTGKSRTADEQFLLRPILRHAGFQPAGSARQSSRKLP